MAGITMCVHLDTKYTFRNWMYLEGRKIYTYPDSSTTGTWSNPFSLSISMVFSQVTLGSTVRGAERHNS